MFKTKTNVMNSTSFVTNYSIHVICFGIIIGISLWNEDLLRSKEWRKYNNLLKVFSDFYVRSYKLKKLSSLGAGFVIFGVICNFFFRLFFGVYWHFRCLWLFIYLIFVEPSEYSLQMWHSWRPSKRKRVRFVA